MSTYIFFVAKPLCSGEGFSTKNVFPGTTQKRHHDQPFTRAISIPPPSKPPHVQLMLLLMAWSPWAPAQWVPKQCSGQPLRTPSQISTYIFFVLLCDSLACFVTKRLCSAEGFSTKNTFHGTTQKRHHDQPSNKAISIPPPSKPPHVQLVLLLLAWSPWAPAQ